MRYEAVEDLVAGPREPSQGEGQASQKEMDGEGKRADRPRGAEHEPQEDIRTTIYPRSSTKATAPEGTSQAVKFELTMTESDSRLVRSRLVDPGRRDGAGRRPASGAGSFGDGSASTSSGSAVNSERAAASNGANDGSADRAEASPRGLLCRPHLGHRAAPTVRCMKELDQLSRSFGTDGMNVHRYEHDRPEGCHSTTGGPRR